MDSGDGAEHVGDGVDLGVDDVEGLQDQVVVLPVFLGVIGDDDDGRGVHHFVKKPVDQHQLVECFLERHVDQVDGDPLVAERLVEQNVDAG